MDSRDDAVRRRDDVTGLELVGGVESRALFLVEHDPVWVEQYAAHEALIRQALGDVAVAVEHIGSTSVPGLAAKPIIDVLVTVPDITAEEDYLDPLLAAGYLLRVREPGHRLVRTEQRDAHVHVLEPDDVAADDYLLLRDRLRRDAADRALYEQTKRELVTREWSDTNAYADAKTDVIEAIKARARKARRIDQPGDVAVAKLVPTTRPAREFGFLSGSVPDGFLDPMSDDESALWEGGDSDPLLP